MVGKTEAQELDAVEGDNAAGATYAQDFLTFPQANVTGMFRKIV